MFHCRRLPHPVSELRLFFVVFGGGGDDGFVGVAGCSISEQGKGIVGITWYLSCIYICSKMSSILENVLLTLFLNQITH